MVGRACKSERGLASSEYAGVLAVVAAVFLAVLALGLDGRISGVVDRAVCIITGGRCGEQRAGLPPQPCLTGTTTTSSTADVLVAVVKIDKDSTLIREDYSDGSAKFTILDNTEAAGELFAGVKGKIAKYGVNYSASADAGLGLEGARVFEFPDQKSADAFQDKVQAAGGFDGILRDITHADDEIPIVGWKNPLGGINDWALDQLGVDDDRDLPTPTQTYMTGREFIDGQAAAGLGAGAVDADLAALVRGAGAVKVNTSGRDKGDAEVSFELEGEADGSLGAAIFGLGAGAGGDASFTATITLDAQDGYRPSRLIVKGTAGYTGTFDVHADLEGKDLGSLRRSLEKLTFTDQAGQGQGVEFTGELDLHDPRNLRATLGVLGAVVSAGGAGGAVTDLVQRFDEDGTLELDTYDTESSETSGEVKVGLGIGGGAGAGTSTEAETGRHGSVRVPGGTFQPLVCARPTP